MSDSQDKQKEQADAKGRSWIESDDVGDQKRCHMTPMEATTRTPTKTMSSSNIFNYFASLFILDGAIRIGQ